MRKTLMPFQAAGAAWLTRHSHALLADEMGLGKTLQAIAAVEALNLHEVLVVCPASVRLNWHQEVRECLGSTVGWDVISYNQASTWTVKLRYDAIILDEAHYLKTVDSQRTQAIFGNERGLARRAFWKWGLTGTPVCNRPMELYPFLKTLGAHVIAPYTSIASYGQRYCGGHFDGRAMNYKGSSNVEELRERLKGIVLRRTKDEVMPELPPKRISRVPLEVTNEELKELWKVEEEISNREAFVSSVHEDFSQLGDLARLLRATGKAKVDASARFISEILETTEKTVVFAYHRDVLSGLARLLSAYRPVVYHGGMNDAQKAEAVRLFVEDAGARVFIGQIQAAGTGINGLQTVASTVVFAELSWVPGVMAQAIDRLHRIGQAAVSVNVYLLHVPGTLESAVLSVVDNKTKVIDRLIEG